MNSINYIVLNSLSEYIDSPDFSQVLNLHYIVHNRPFTITVGIYKPEFVSPHGRTLSLEEIISEQSSLHSNAEFVRMEVVSLREG